MENTILTWDGECYRELEYLHVGPMYKGLVIILYEQILNN